MAKYSISYSRPGEAPSVFIIEAKSEPEARIRFMNLSWVAFTSIVINSIALAHNQPETAKQAALKAKGARKAKRPPEAAAAPVATAAPGDSWRDQCDRLSKQISDLSDKAMIATRKGNHRLAAKLRAEAKEFAATRAEITKRNKRK